MPSIGMNACLSTVYNQELRTSGLDTCVGAVAFGKPGPSGINKVIAHASTPSVASIIGSRFIAEVQNSGMQLYGICLSVPDPTRNDSLRSREVKAMMRQAGYSEEQCTAEAIANYKAGFRNALQQGNDDAKYYCQQLGVSISVYKRKNADVDKSSPYGTMRATASPRGQVTADGQKMADIPEPTQSGGSSSSGKGAGGSGRSSGGSGSGGSSSKYGSGSGSSSKYGSSSGYSGQQSSHYKSSSSSKSGRR